MNRTNPPLEIEQAGWFGYDSKQREGSRAAADTQSAVYHGNATAYTNDQGEWTASGMPAQVGVVAGDPDVIPYGTRLYITTEDGSYVYGYCVAGDTGSFIYDGTGTIVDLFYDTVEECCEFGRRAVIVYVLD